MKQGACGAQYTPLRGEIEAKPCAPQAQATVSQQHPRDRGLLTVHSCTETASHWLRSLGRAHNSGDKSSESKPPAAPHAMTSSRHKCNPSGCSSKAHCKQNKKKQFKVANRGEVA